MTSYESLADAAFAAALELQRMVDGRGQEVGDFMRFANLLQEPIVAEQSYKLLYDARNTSLYRSAWSTVSGDSAGEIKYDILLKSISDFLHRSGERLQAGKFGEASKIASFCLALNRAFLEENARNQFESFRGRQRHGSR